MMGVDEEFDPKELERQKLLDEIRRRAEEAELQRIEEEERAVERPAHSLEREEPPAVGKDAPREESVVDEGKLIELRSELAVAINKKDLPTASDIFLQLAEIIPGTREISSFEKKLRQLRQEAQEEREKTRIEQEAEADERQRTRDSRKRKSEELYQETFSLYQQEKYDRALEKAEWLIDLDPMNEEVVELRSKIEKARALAQEVSAEEERRKADLDPSAESERKQEMREPVSGKKDDVWGGEPIPHGDPEFAFNTESEAARKLPAVPLTLRILRKIEKVRVPVKPLLGLVAVVAVFVVGYLVIERVTTSEHEFSNSILILPGWYSPADSISDYMSYSLAEGIVDHLSKYPDLLIIAARSARGLTYTKGGPASAARQIGVQFYLHWSIRTTPASVSMELTLRDTSLTDPVWSTTSLSSFRELPAAIAEIAGQIAARAGLSDAGVPATSGLSSANPDAYLMYLKGRYMLGHPAKHVTHSAVETFTLAVEADPGFREAKTSLALAHLREFEQTGDNTLVSRASALLSSLDSDRPVDASELMTRGLALQAESDYDRAEKLLSDAVLTSPGNAEAHRRIAILYLCRSRLEDALTHARLAVQLDPLNHESHSTLGLAEIYRRDYQAALSSFEQGARFAPNKTQYTVLHFPELYIMLQRHEDALMILTDEVARERDNFTNYYRLGRVYQAAGKSIDLWREVFEKAEKLARQRLSGFPGEASTRSFLALIETRLGKHEEAATDIDRALRISPLDPVVLYHAARVYAMQKENEKALEYLLRAVGVRYDLQSIADMDLFNLQAEEGFAAVITR